MIGVEPTRFGATRDDAANPGGGAFALGHSRRRLLAMVGAGAVAYERDAHEHRTRELNGFRSAEAGERWPA
jgi:hypothetical protein